MHHVLVRVLVHNLYDRMTFLVSNICAGCSVKHVCGIQCQIVLNILFRPEVHYYSCVHNSYTQH